MHTDTPAPPSTPRITDTTKRSISMTWTRPMYDGGSDVTGYFVEILEEGTEQWYRANLKALKTTEYVAAGLAVNKKYRFRVAAINNNGTGEFSEPTAEVEPSEKIGMYKCMVSIYLDIFMVSIYLIYLLYNKNKKLYRIVFKGLMCVIS